MEKCLNCGKPLSGLKKMFCSDRCKASLRWKRMTEGDKVIARKRNRELYAEKRVERLKQKKDYYLKNRNEVIAKNLAYKKNHPETDKRYANSIKGKYRDYKKGAKKRGYVFELTLEDFSKFESVPCFYCGDLFELVGVDRRNNKIGYTKKNSVSCCPVCNRMKWAFREQDFINKCKQIYEYNK